MRASTADDDTRKRGSTNETRFATRRPPVNGKVVLVFSGIAVGIAKRREGRASKAEAISEHPANRIPEPGDPFRIEPSRRR